MSGEEGIQNEGSIVGAGSLPKHCEQQIPPFSLGITIMQQFVDLIINKLSVEPPVMLLMVPITSPFCCLIVFLTSSYEMQSEVGSRHYLYTIDFLEIYSTKCKMFQQKVN